MRRSVERSQVHKGLIEELMDTTDDICERYGIGVSGGSEKSGE